MLITARKHEPRLGARSGALQPPQAGPIAFGGAVDAGRPSAVAAPAAFNFVFMSPEIRSSSNWA